MEFMEKQIRKNSALSGKAALKTPVVFIIFNRFDTAKQVFKAIAKVKPEKLFVVADGPRVDKAGEAEKCVQVRSLIEAIDWPCKVYKNFSDANMGCDPRIVSGLDWVFSQTDRAIILEDDCLPDPSFFYFCDELLEYYKDDKRIMQISGENKFYKTAPVKSSYYFTRNIEIWGWATWARAWRLRDAQMKTWPQYKKNKLINALYPQKSARYHFSRLFDKYYKNEISSWDGNWAYSICKQSAFSIAPKNTLVKNIGTDSAEATHGNVKSIYRNMDTHTMEFPLVHPEFIGVIPEIAAREEKYRRIDQDILPYPLNKWASYIRRFLSGEFF